MDATKEQLKKFSNTKRYPTLTGIADARQQYLDEPVYLVVSKVKKIVLALGQAFNYATPRDITQLTGYNRHILTWGIPK